MEITQRSQVKKALAVEHPPSNKELKAAELQVRKIRKMLIIQPSIKDQVDVLKRAAKEQRQKPMPEEGEEEEEDVDVDKDEDEAGGENGGEEEDEQPELKKTDVHIFWDLDNKRPELDPGGTLERLK